MKLTKSQKEAIIRAIVHDIPKPDVTKRHAQVQAAIVKAMSPECRKVYNKTPSALSGEHTGPLTYDGCTWETRTVVVGDCPKKTFNEIIKKYEDEDEAIKAAHRKVELAVNACSTLKQLETLLPEFKKYFPTEAQPTKNLPAVANLVADLTKLGWPKHKQLENQNA